MSKFVPVALDNSINSSIRKSIYKHRRLVFNPTWILFRIFSPFPEFAGHVAVISQMSND